MTEHQDLDFTDYVRSLDGAGNPPSRELFSAVWEQLRGALTKELKTRGLWTSPPSYLGISGSSWSHPETLDELVADCYTYNFVHRLSGLRNRLLVVDNVTGTVFTNIRRFLTHAQQRADPLGYQVFERLKGAVDSLIESQRLHVLSGDARIRNRTLLGFRPVAAGPDIARETNFEAPAQLWADELLPGLLLARGKERIAVVERLAQHIFLLHTEMQVEAFFFSDLIRPFKGSVRARWVNLWQTSEGELVFEEGPSGKALPVDRRIEPDLAWQDRQDLQQVQSCIDRQIERAPLNKKTIQYLAAYWSFARDYAQDIPSFAVSAGRVKMPSNSALAEQLGIPRDRIPGLRKTLGEMYGRCLSDPGTHAATPRQMPADGMPGRQRLQEELRRRTEDAAERYRRNAMKVAVREGKPPQPGDVFTAKAGDGVIELLVLESDEKRAELVVAPVDDHPSRGPSDVLFSAIAVAGLVRFGLQRPVHAQMLHSATLSGRLEPSELDELLRLRASLDPSISASIPWLEDTLADSHHIEQMDRLEIALSEMTQGGAARSTSVLALVGAVQGRLDESVGGAQDPLGPSGDGEQGGLGESVDGAQEHLGSSMARGEPDQLGRRPGQGFKAAKKSRWLIILAGVFRSVGASSSPMSQTVPTFLPWLTKAALATVGGAVLAVCALQPARESRSFGTNDPRLQQKSLAGPPISCERYEGEQSLVPCYSLPFSDRGAICCCDGVVCTVAMCHFEICCPQGTYPGGGECNLKPTSPPNNLVDEDDPSPPSI